VASKRIIVVTSDVPFVEGGHLVIARSTIRALRECGYEADLVLTPQNRFGRQFRAYLANWMTDVGEDGLGRRIHQVISFRFPSYAVRHPLHVCWLNHRLREYYDLWEVLSAELSLKSHLKEIFRRRIIHAVDNYLLKHNVTKLLAQSETIRARLIRWGKIRSEVLYPPPPQRKYRTDGYHPFIFSISRLQKLKRLDLLIAAFSHIKNQGVTAVIVGDGPEKQNLVRMAKEAHLEKKIFFFGSADEETILSHYSRCRAVFFAPLREDYGLVTAEAFASRKAVITSEDSGGPAELVTHGQTGFVLPPDPRIIAEKIDIMAEDERLAERMGGEAQAFISRITWEGAVKKLVICD
jgi:glycosyltransferase involved in cell wall biosynthesis